LLSFISVSPFSDVSRSPTVTGMATAKTVTVRAKTVTAKTARRTAAKTMGRAMAKTNRTDWATGTTIGMAPTARVSPTARATTGSVSPTPRREARR